MRDFAQIPQVCSVFAPSRLDASIVMYRDTTGCGGSRTLSPPLEGTMRQEGDGIYSYQPPSRASNTVCVSHTPAPAHRMWRPGTGEPPMRTPEGTVTCVLAPRGCQTKPVVGRPLGTFLSQKSRANGILEQNNLLPCSSFLSLHFLLLRCCLCSSHLNLQPSAPSIGVSIKNGPQTCFSSALNVFPIKSRWGELKEQFSGRNKMT